MSDNNYINTIYDENKRPRNDYPIKLINYLCKIYSIKPGMRILEPGCGRGDFLYAFKDAGLEVFGLDKSCEIKILLKDIDIEVSNIEKDRLPYDDSFFDIVYSKSLIEHLYNPDRYFLEAFRVLKSGGKLITLVPDWESNYKIYFDDFTHRTPFTKISLFDLYEMCGFDTVTVNKFRQLPCNWRFPVLNIISSVTSIFTPVRIKNKFLRWSRELMLIGCGQKK